MHRTSLDNMRDFQIKYVPHGSKVLDVGSLNLNGTYKALFKGCHYIGFDLVPGDNVDVTSWDEVDSDSMDAVISGQTFEHVEDDQALMNKINDVLKLGGVCCIIAPSVGVKHYEPDYRRYQPEDMIKLAEGAGMEILEAGIKRGKPWFDCVLVAKKVAAKPKRRSRQVKTETEE